MTTIRNGFFLELKNYSTGRIVFSAATDELTEEAFRRLWSAVGDGILKGVITPKPGDRVGQYELRVSPINGAEW